MTLTSSLKAIDDWSKAGYPSKAFPVNKERLAAICAADDRRHKEDLRREAMKRGMPVCKCAQCMGAI